MQNQDREQNPLVIINPAPDYMQQLSAPLFPESDPKRLLETFNDPAQALVEIKQSTPELEEYSMQSLQIVSKFLDGFDPNAELLLSEDSTESIEQLGGLQNYIHHLGKESPEKVQGFLDSLFQRFSSLLALNMDNYFTPPDISGLCENDEDGTVFLAENDDDETFLDEEEKALAAIERDADQYRCVTINTIMNPLRRLFNYSAIWENKDPNQEVTEAQKIKIIPTIIPAELVDHIPEGFFGVSADGTPIMTQKADEKDPAALKPYQQENIKNLITTMEDIWANASTKTHEETGQALQNIIRTLYLQDENETAYTSAFLDARALLAHNLADLDHFAREDFFYKLLEHVGENKEISEHLYQEIHDSLIKTCIIAHDTKQITEALEKQEGLTQNKPLTLDDIDTFMMTPNPSDILKAQLPASLPETFFHLALANRFLGDMNKMTHYLALAYTADQHPDKLAEIMAIEESGLSPQDLSKQGIEDTELQDAYQYAKAGQINILTNAI